MCVCVCVCVCVESVWGDVYDFIYSSSASHTHTHTHTHVITSCELPFAEDEQCQWLLQCGGYVEYGYGILVRIQHGNTRRLVC